MNPPKKATVHHQSEEQEQLSGQQHTQQPTALEFATVEELLRHDASNTPLPPTIARRLEDSVNQSPAPTRRSWWRRLFGPPRS
jgi:hypothetical protein